MKKIIAIVAILLFYASICTAQVSCQNPSGILGSGNTGIAVRDLAARNYPDRVEIDYVGDYRINGFYNWAWGFQRVIPIQHTGVDGYFNRVTIKNYGGKWIGNDFFTFSTDQVPCKRIELPARPEMGSGPASNCPNGTNIVGGYFTDNAITSYISTEQELYSSASNLIRANQEIHFGFVDYHPTIAIGQRVSVQNCFQFGSPITYLTPDPLAAEYQAFMGIAKATLVFYKACSLPAPTNLNTLPYNGQPLSRLLSWGTVSGNAGYEIQWAKQNEAYGATGTPAQAGAGGRATIAATGTTGLILNNLLGNISYKWHIRAKCSNTSFGPWSGDHEFTMPCNKFNLSKFSNTNLLIYNWVAGSAFDFTKLVNLEAGGVIRVFEVFSDGNESGTSIGNQFTIPTDVPTLTKRSFNVYQIKGAEKCLVQKVRLDVYPKASVIETVPLQSEAYRAQSKVFYASNLNSIVGLQGIQVWPISNCSTDPKNLKYEVWSSIGVDDMKKSPTGENMNREQSALVNQIKVENASKFVSFIYTNPAEWSGFCFAYPHYTLSNEPSLKINRYIYSKKYNSLNGWYFDSYINSQPFTTQIFTFRVVVRRNANPSEYIGLYIDNQGSIVDMPGKFYQSTTVGTFYEDQRYAEDKFVLVNTSVAAPIWSLIPSDRQDYVLTNNDLTTKRYGLTYISNLELQNPSKIDEDKHAIKLFGICARFYITGFTGTATPGLGNWPGVEIGTTENAPIILKCASDNSQIPKVTANSVRYCQTICSRQPVCRTFASSSSSRMAGSAEDIESVNNETSDAEKNAVNSKSLYARSSPNPFTSQVTLRYMAGGNGASFIQVRNAFGGVLYTSPRQVLPKGATQQYIVNTGAWASGTYFVTTHLSNGKTVTERIVKQ